MIEPLQLIKQRQVEPVGEKALPFELVEKLLDVVPRNDQHDHGLQVALGMRQLNGPPTFIEEDDNYTREAPHFYGKYRTKPWYRTKEEARKPGNSGYSYEAHKEVVPFADRIICATEYLADIYSDWNHNVHVCPNSVDPDDWQYEREEHDDFRIVYYGSSSHGSDTPIVTKALKWAAKQPGVTVYTVGRGHAGPVRGVSQDRSRAWRKARQGIGGEAGLG